MPNVSSVVKHFPVAKEGFTTTTASSTASAATTVQLNSVSGYSNGDIVALVIEPTNTTKKQVFTGVVDTAGVQITSVVWTEGTNTTHAAGSTVVDYWTATHMSMVTKGLLVEHLQTGAHAAITTTSITNAGNISQTDGSSINDNSGNELVKFAKTGSAVNEVTVTNAATGNAPTIAATGGDTNIPLKLSGKGTGAVQMYVNGVDQMGAWQSYSPSWTGTGSNPAIGNGTLTGKYIQIGKTVFFRITIQAGSTTTYGTGNFRFSLPVTAASGYMTWQSLGTWMGTNSGSVYGGILTYQSTTTVGGLNHSTVAAGAQVSEVGTSSPVSWNTTSTLSVTGSYEAA